VQTLRSLMRLPELAGVDAGTLTAFLDACVDNRIMVRDGDRYLAIAVARPARAWVSEPSPVAAEVAA
jgi:hypothetical protein